MPTPSRPATVIGGAPLRVAECGPCGQLFALQTTAGAVRCPACDAESSVATLEVAELGVAQPVEVRLPEPAAAAPANAAPTAPPPTDTPPTDTPPKKITAERPEPTVADWLLRNGQPELSATDSHRANEEPASESDTARPTDTARPSEKPSLSETLGFNFGSFRLGESSTENADSAANGATTANQQEEILGELIDCPEDGKPEASRLGLEIEDFGFDPADIEEELAGDDPDEGHPVALRQRNRQSRHWGALAATAAGLLLLAGGGIAFWSLSTGDSALVADASGRERRVDIRSEPTNDTPTESAVEPAGFVADSSVSELEADLPIPSPSDAPADAVPAESAVAAPPSDPFTMADASTPPASLAPELPAEPAALPPDDAPEQDESLAAAADEPQVEPVSFEPEPASAPPSRQSVYQTAAASSPVATDWSNRPDSAPGLVDAPTHTVDELEAAIRRAAPAGSSFGAGSLSDPEQVSQMGQSYAELAHLAQVVTLLDPATRGGMLTAELEATQTFRRLWVTANGREQSQRVALPWIAWTGRPYGGVFFSGRADRVRRVGELVEYEIEVGESLVPVILAEQFDHERFIAAGAAGTNEVGIIGVVIEQPREWLAGYEGPDRRVVWARKTIPLSRAKPQ